MKKLALIATIFILLASIVSVSLVSAAPGIFGKDTIGGTAATQADNTVWACKFSLTERGHVSKLTAYLKGTNPTCEVKAAIYDDDSNKPNNRVAIMSTGVATPKTAQWYNFTLDSPVTLDAGDYWLAVHHGVKPTDLYYDTGADGQWQSITADYATGPPASWGTSASTNIWEASIYATYTIPTWASYSDPGYGTPCDIFSDYASEHTVYMYGTEFAATTTYKVIFWDFVDPDWVNRQTEPTASDGSGNLSAAHTFVYGTDTEGNWHCAVYTAIANPTSYVSTDPDIVADDTSYTGVYAFYVYASAIPEFPTIFAAIGVAGLCFSIYYWMRRRVYRVHGVYGVH